MKFILITNLIWLGLAASVAAQKYPGQDILHYRFYTSLNESNNIVTVDADLDVEIREGTYSMSLDLEKYQVKSGKGMSVEYVLVNGDTAEFAHKKNKLQIVLASAAGKVKLKLHYSGIPSDGLIISQNEYGDRTYFADHWPNRAHHWLAVVDHPTEKATCEFLVETPKKYQVVANGDLQVEKDVDEYRKMTHWIMNEPIPSKVMVIGVAEFLTKDVGGNGFSQAWVYKKSGDEVLDDFKEAHQIYEFMMEQIGEYPFSKLHHVETKTIYAGMENAGNIYYDERAVSGEGKIDGLIAHEIAHQWFGNSASEIDWSHVWLSEGFATYLSFEYLENRYGTDSLIKYLDHSFKKILSYEQKYPEKTILIKNVTDPKKILSPLVYEKAAMMLRTLAYQLGQETFLKVLKTYYQRFKYSNASSEDFQYVAEEVSGASLDRFFRDWLSQPGHPEITANIQVKKRRLTIKQNSGMTYDLFLPVLIKTKSGETVVENIRINQSDQIVTLQTKKAVKIEIDPEKRVFAEWSISYGK